jgi:thiol-disulfide isomerase/thioredoxin
MGAGSWIVGVVVVAAAALPQEQSPEQVLAEVKAIGEPPFDAVRKAEPGYLERYKSQQHELCRRKAALLLELCLRHQDDARLGEWIDRRWVLLGWNQDPRAVAAEVLADIEAVAPRFERDVVAQHASYWRAWFGLHAGAIAPEQRVSAALAFVDRWPADERGPRLLELAASSEAPTADRLVAYRRLAQDWPRTHAGRFASGMTRRLEALGKPFTLEFTDAIGGKLVRTSELRGKVVVVDFWATTCGPCVQEMPALKELERRYGERGLQLIGVSVDQDEASGGLAALREFVARESIPWPQYYQGAGYESDFSRSWGVGSAPTKFLLDRAGRLRAEGRLEDLEQQVVRLLDESR